MNELTHDWGTPRSAVLRDATLVERPLERADALDYLERLPSLGLRSVELPLEPVLVEAAQELELRVTCPVESEADLELAERLAVAIRVPPGLAGREFPHPVEVRLASIGQTGPPRLASCLESWRSLDHLSLCLEDEQGRVQPEGLSRLLEFLGRLQSRLGTAWPVIWSQRHARGMELLGALAAVEAGVTGVRCTGLGLGGWIALDGLLVNLCLEGRWEGPTDRLADYCRELARAAGAELAPNYPVAGRDAFRTATGVHAMAMWRAREQGRPELVDRIYSGVPASEFGFEQEIEVGPMSGRSNVWWWSSRHALALDEASVDRVLAAAKRHFRSLTADEIRAILEDRS